MVLGFLLRAPITVALALVNIAVYALASRESLFLAASSEWIDAFSFTPAMLLYPQDWYRVLTAMFMHANLFHILFNMYFLLVFGGDVERRLGPFRYLVLYLASGVLASVFHSGLVPLTGSIALIIPAVGASGAISGVLGAYLILFPTRTLSICMFLPIPLCFNMYAAYFLVFWLALQVSFGLVFHGTGGGGVAFFAHVGGFVAGVLLAFALAPRRVRAEPGVLGEGVVAVIVRRGGLSLTLKIALAVLMAAMVGGALYSAYAAGEIEGIYVFDISTQSGGVAEEDEAVFSLPDWMVIAPASSGPRVVFNRLLWSGVIAVDDPNATIAGVIYNGRVEVPGTGLTVRLTLTGVASYDERGVLRSLEGEMVTDVLMIRMGRIVGIEENVFFDVRISSSEVAEAAGDLVVRPSAVIAAIATLASLYISVFRDSDVAEEEVEYVYAPPAGYLV